MHYENIPFFLSSELILYALHTRHSNYTGKYCYHRTRYTRYTRYSSNNKFNYLLYLSCNACNVCNATFFVT